MTPERFLQIEELYHAAKEDRAVLDQADADLRREVESLLAQDSSKTGILDQPAWVGAAGLTNIDATATMITPGTQLGPYKIEAPIGAGGMGEVFRATDTRLRRTVAIKILPRDRVADPDRKKRFLQEARAASALNHPNIVTLHDIANDSGTDYLVMEYVAGQSLDKLITAKGLPLGEALGYAQQIASALAAAHTAGIVHRDIKPANVIVTAEGHVKVLDFGLAKLTERAPKGAGETQAQESALTEAGTIMGTVAYMSPEQASAKPLDHRTDIFSLGVVLYEMLAGKRPFRGKSQVETMHALINDPVPPLANVPPRVEEIFDKALEKDPKERYQSAADLSVDLRRAQKIGPAAQIAPAPTRRPRLAWSVAGLLFLGLWLVSYIHFREQPALPEVERFQLPLPEKVSLQDNQAFSLSPDSRTLAFAAIGSDGVARVWVRTLDSLDARPLPSSEIVPSGTLIFWSPDSRFMVFQTQGKLKKVGLTGDPPQSICDIPGNLTGGSWNREDVIIFGTDTIGLLRVPAAGGAATTLTRLDSTRQERIHGFPVFLPDGRHFLYSRISNTLENNGIYVGALDAKPEEQGARRLTASSIGAVFVPFLHSGGGKLLFQHGSTLLAQTLDTSRLELTGEAVPVAEHVGNFRATGFFSASGNRLIYRSSPGQTAQMTWFDRQGTVLGLVDEPFSHDAGPSLSPRGERVASARYESAGVHIWLSDLARGVTTRFTFDQGIHSTPVWSPDGSYVAFSSAASGRFDLYQKSSNGTGGEQLLFESGESKFPTSWSSDGRFLLYSSRNAKTGSDLWVLPMDGGAADGLGIGKPFPVARTEFAESFGKFAPDSKWIAYTSNESGESEVYVQRFTPPSAGGTLPAAEKSLVSRGGGALSSWRGDGKELYYSTREGKMMAVQVATNPTFKAGIPQPLFQMPPNALGWNVSADGKRFLVAVPVSESVPASFTEVLNWQAAMK